MIDESTNIACNKHLCIVDRYYSTAEKKIATSFVGMVAVIKASSEQIFQSMKLCLEKSGLRVSDCIGFASDVAAAMIGQHDSVWSRIVKESPYCIMVKCICHFLALCIKHAFEKLPSNLGFLLSEIPKWFSNSILRSEEYKKLFDANNADTDSSSFVSRSLVKLDGWYGAK